MSRSRRKGARYLHGGVKAGGGEIEGTLAATRNWGGEKRGESVRNRTEDEPRGRIGTTEWTA